MKKLILSLVLAVCLLLLAGCGGPGNSASTLPTQASPGDDLSGTTDGLTGDGNKSYKIVKAAADEPVAAVRENGCWGYVNTKGEWVIAPQYSQVYPFVDNVATVKTDTGWQLINKNNEVIAKLDSGIEVVDPLHPTTYPQPGRKDSGCTIFDGMIIIAKDMNGDRIITSKDRYGYADITGRIVVEPKYKGAEAFQEGLAAVDFSESSMSTDYNWGYIDKTGKTVIAPEFSWAGVFSEGIARVQSNGKYKHLGCIDKTGQWLFSSENKAVYANGDFKNRVAPAKIGHEFGIIDKTGNTVKTVPGSNNQRMASNYSPIGADAFKDGLYPLFDVSKPNTEDGFFPHGFIDTEGNFAIPAQTEWKVIQGFSDGMCCVFIGKSYTSMEKTYGYIDKTGKVVIPIKYYKANMFNFGYAAVATGDPGDMHYMVIDKTGNTVAELRDVTDAFPFTK